jgi:catechol 2,3-dioxygenase-like lactoylglutathione lyase family enzyme
MAIFRYIVDDIDKCLPFYSELNMRVKERWGPPFAILRHEDLELWLSAPGTSATKPLANGLIPAPGSGWGRLVLVVEDIAALLTKSSVLSDSIVASPSTGPGGIHALVKDPSGNLVELYQVKGP